MSESVTAYLTHKPWSAADGGKLHGSIRVIEHTGAPTGMQHRFEIRDRSSAGDRTRAGQLKPRAAPPPKREPRQPKPLPTENGWLKLISEPFTKPHKGAERTFVTVRCRCDRRVDLEQGKWASKHAPRCCAGCVQTWRRMFPKHPKGECTETRRAA